MTDGTVVSGGEGERDRNGVSAILPGDAPTGGFDRVGKRETRALYAVDLDEVVAT